jgi:hypothetical protein
MGSRRAARSGIVQGGFAVGRLSLDCAAGRARAVPWDRNLGGISGACGSNWTPGTEGENGFFLLPRSVGGNPQAVRDEEILAHRGFRSALIPVLVSALRNPI